MEDEDEEKPISRTLVGDFVVDEISEGKEEYGEISLLIFHVGKTRIELALCNYGYKFEEHFYDWVVNAVTDNTGDTVEDYRFGGFLPKDYPLYELETTETQ
jgi:hypothetical protein